MSDATTTAIRRSPLLAIYAALVFAFIYLPIIVLVVYHKLIRSSRRNV